MRTDGNITEVVQLLGHQEDSYVQEGLADDGRCQGRVEQGHKHLQHPREVPGEVGRPPAQQRPQKTHSGLQFCLQLKTKTNAPELCCASTFYKRSVCLSVKHIRNLYKKICWELPALLKIMLITSLIKHMLKGISTTLCYSFCYFKKKKNLLLQMYTASKYRLYLITNYWYRP